MPWVYLRKNKLTFVLVPEAVDSLRFTSERGIKLQYILTLMLETLNSNCELKDVAIDQKIH